MDHRRNARAPANAPDSSSITEADLFACAILGKPIPRIVDPEAEARARREELERLATFSQRHKAELQTLVREEAEAKADRQRLEFLAQFSSKHAIELRRIEGAEAAARENLRRVRQFAERLGLVEAGWDSAKHPRLGGPPNAGWWATTGGGAGGASPKTDRFDDGAGQVGMDGRRVPSEMLDLAHAWSRTNNLLQQSRRDIETLTARIASESAKLGSGDGYSHIHAQNIAKAQRDLEIAKNLVPQLETQSRALEQQYHDSGYDEVPYFTWTPGETWIGGHGIEKVGRAVDMSGSPAGLTPTGIEVDIALAAASVFQLGKAVLRKAGAAAPKGAAVEPAALKPYGGPGGGHHVPAKSAFEGATGYNANRALAIPNAELKRWGVKHSAVTGAQRTLYGEFARGVEQLTWEAVERIEIEALVRGRMDPTVARATVNRAIQALKRAGVTRPTRIPWGGTQ